MNICIKEPSWLHFEQWLVCRGRLFTYILYIYIFRMRVFKHRRLCEALDPLDFNPLQPNHTWLVCIRWFMQSCGWCAALMSNHGHVWAVVHREAFRNTRSFSNIIIIEIEYNNVKTKVKPLQFARHQGEHMKTWRIELNNLLDLIVVYQWRQLN